VDRAVAAMTAGPRRLLLELGAATLGESGAKVMAPRVHPIWADARLAAPALPVQCAPGDNLAVHVAVQGAPEAVALVVSVGNLPERGYWGEVLTTAAEARRLAGIVIDGGVRDSEALEAHRFPVFATTVALEGATKTAPGTVGATVEVGGVDVHAGDWVVGDRDGVVVVPGASLDDVLARATARAEKEQRLFGELRAGRTTVELLGLDPTPVRRHGGRLS
jgi:4-hydroxy-4-methyl-2-oxoglutarate aldolase